MAEEPDSSLRSDLPFIHGNYYSPALGGQVSTVMNKKKNLAIARASYDAYVAKDRSAIEELISDDFHFTSPLDNRINRTVYFDRC